MDMNPIVIDEDDDQHQHPMESQVMEASYQEAQEEAFRAIKKQRLEQEALQKAIQLSQQEHEDAKIAQELHQQEMESVDRDYATALQQSEEEIIQQQQNTVQHCEQNQKQWEYFDQAIVDRSNERQEGAWDCTVCTAVNPPYTNTRCIMCQNPAPAHVLTFQTLPDVKFGIELEIVLTHGKRDGFTLESLAKNLTTMSTDQEKVVYRGYTHETTDYWKIVTDASIQTTYNDDLCFELVSPVLCGEEGIDKLKRMLECTRRLGIGTNTSCGFHVHVDATTADVTQLKRLCQTFCAVENAFDLLVARSWEVNPQRDTRRANSNTFCKSNRLVFGEMSNQQRWNRIQEARTVRYLVRMINPDFDRYRKLNLTNITKRDRPSTVEYRNHGSVFELKEAEAWVRLVVRFTHNAFFPGNTNSCAAVDSCCIPESASNTRNELERLFDVVGCSGLEQYFVVERRLFHGQLLSNQWQCNRCHRRFETSRSLSQHCAALGH